MNISWFFWPISISVLYFFSLHILLLKVIRWIRPNKTNLAKAQESMLPPMVMIVPFFNEEKLIVGKLENCLGLHYSEGKIKFVFVDGGSTDKSLELVLAYERKYPDKIKLLRSPRAGKIPQINHVLSLIKNEEQIIVISDTDAVVENEDALIFCASHFLLNPGVELVGGWSSPSNVDNQHQDEVAYWDKQNRLRFLEMNCYSSSIIIATFYSFRKNFLTQFPSDCIADDVYISLLCHLKRNKIIYSPEIKITEIRSPSKIKELFLHKLRKSNAYMTELFRFLYKIPYMGLRVKFIFINKLLQFFYMPWGILVYGLYSLTYLLNGHLNLILIINAIIFLFTLAASMVMTPPPGYKRGGFKIIALISSLKIFILMNLVLILDFFLYPFWKQNSVYRKVKV